MYPHNNKYTILHSYIGTFKFNLNNLITTSSTYNTALISTNVIISSSHFNQLHNINKLKKSSNTRIINAITHYPIILLVHNNYPYTHSPNFNHNHIIAILDGYHRTVKSHNSNQLYIPSKLIPHDHFLSFISSSF